MSPEKGNKVLIVQNNDDICLHIDRLVSSHCISVFASCNLYQTVRILSEHQRCSGLIVGALESFTIEKMRFFYLLSRSPGWRCCLSCSIIPLDSGLLALVRQERLHWVQTKEEIAEYISKFIESDAGANLPAESASLGSQTRVSESEYLLSPEEVQALLSA